MHETTIDDAPRPDAGPLAHVVLHRPQIPGNTGAIGRTCVATGSKLWIVRPAAFQLDEKRLRRAGLDYWPHLQLGDAANWEQLRQQLPDTSERRYWYFTRFAKRSIWDCEMKPGDVLVFGSETEGLPETVLPRDEDGGVGPQAIRLPTTELVRSLNLATTVGIAIYELQRRMAQQVNG